MSLNKLFTRGMDLAKQAVELDKAGKHEDAFQTYMQSAETLIEFLRHNKNPKLKQIVESRMEEYIQRAKYLKSTITGKKVKVTRSSSSGPSGGERGDPLSAAEEDDDLDEDTKKLREMISQTIVTDKPDVTWDDIAGLRGVKQALREAIVLPIVKPEIFQGARKPWTGILLFGPPGCGKTLMAKASASECEATFYAADSASLVSKWLGESEKLVKGLFELARKTSPSLIFIDEIDSLTMTRGSGSEGSGERRLKTQLMQEMQGMKTTTKHRVLILGATNRPWDLDTAFLRRFEKKVYIPLPDLESRREILKIHSKGIEIDDDVDYDELARLTVGYSGSDISLVCREAIMIPVREIDLQGAFDSHDVDIRPVSRKDFISALEVQKPVSTPEDLRRFKEWADDFGV